MSKIIPINGGDIRFEVKIHHLHNGETRLIAPKNWKLVKAMLLDALQIVDNQIVAAIVEPSIIVPPE